MMQNFIFRYTILLLTFICSFELRCMEKELKQEPYGTQGEVLKRLSVGPNSYRVVIFDSKGLEESEVAYFYLPHVYAHINFVWTREQSRRRGLARFLLLQTCDHLSSLECERISLSVLKDNEPAISLYKQCGFVKKPADFRESSLDNYEKKLTK